MARWFFCLEPVAACYIMAEWVVEKASSGMRWERVRVPSNWKTSQ